MRYKIIVSVMPQRGHIQQSSIFDVLTNNANHIDTRLVTSKTRVEKANYSKA